MKDKLGNNAQHNHYVLTNHGCEFEIQELPDSAHSAQDAANAIGCRVPQIAKSILFKTSESKNPILAIASGSNRIDVKKVATHLNQPIETADARYVKEHTGFSIGGVSPVGLKAAMPIFIDEDLLAFDEIWAAAGTPHAVVKVKSDTLPALTQGKVINLRE